MQTEQLRLHSIADRVEIAPGVAMPRLGLGTSHSRGRDVQRAIEYAFGIGYRLVDTAAVYGNEREVGEALARTGVPRDEFFVTTKVWNTEQGYRSTFRAFEESRSRLGLDYVDLYLIHWPETGLTGETWRALEELHEQGATRAIGVSNFKQSDFEELYGASRVSPALDQIELHPGKSRAQLAEFCRTHGVTVQAWAPLQRGKVAHIELLEQIGRSHGKSSAQVALRWILEQGITTIPKSVHEARIAENADVFDFELTADEMSTIDALDRG